MAFPTAKVTIGFPVTSSYSGYFVLDSSVLNGTATLAGPSQIVDVSSDLTGAINVTRGRTRETDQFQAGTATFTLRNEARKYDPLNSSGPYFPGILPRAPVAIYLAGQQIFGGYVDDYDVQYFQGGPGGETSVVTVSCVDAFTLLANARLNNVSFTAKTSGARIIDILTAGDVNFPGAYTVASGTMTMQASTQNNVAALDHANTVAASEGGWLYIDRTGTLTFQDVNIWPLSAALFPNGQLTLTDHFDASGTPISYNGPGVPYVGVGMLSAATLLYNRVEGQRTGGVNQIADDAASQAQYLLRDLSLPSLELDSDVNVLGLCLLYLARYKQPEVRFDYLEVELNGQSSSVQINVAALDVSSVVIAERTKMPGGGPSIKRLSMVESLTWSIDWDAQSVRLQLGMADLQSGVVGFILDSATLGILDTDTLGLGDVESTVSTGGAGGGAAGGGKALIVPRVPIG